MHDKRTVSLLTYCSPKHGFAYLAVPKTASSSIVSWLLKLEGITWQDENPRNNRYRVVQRNLRLVHHPDVKNPVKFTVVRNPITRLVSAYLDKFVNGGHRPARKIKIDMGKLETGITFREFINWLASTNLKRVDAHWMPQAYMVNLFKPDLLGTIEDLESFLKKVESRIGIPVNIGWDRKVLSLCKNDLGPTMDIPSEQLKGKNPVLENFYDDQLKEIVHRVYEEDFRLWEDAKSEAWGHQS